MHTQKQINRKKNSIYQEKKIKENLFQYEMGIELGADLEFDKQRHRKCYEKKLNQIHHHK